MTMQNISTFKRNRSLFVIQNAAGKMGNILLVALMSLFISCGGGNSDGEGSRKIQIDGSSTVYPITEAIAEEYRKEHSSVRVTVGVSGTGGGLQKFSKGQIGICDASREIQQKEMAKCKKNGVQYVKLTVAYDGIAVVVNPENDWMDSVSVEELKKLWEPKAQEKINKWSQIRPQWPDKEISLYGPGVASGTYDYFTEAIVGESGASRGDYMSSEDDNVLVQGVAGDKYALGFFGLAYYKENNEKMRLVAVDDGTGKAVKPTMETIAHNTYKPLSRPLYIYVSKTAANDTTARNFVEFYLKQAGSLVQDVGYIPLPEKEYKQELTKFKKFAEGSPQSKE